jgi:hypothetical protein
MKQFSFGVQWVAGLSTQGEATGFTSGGVPWSVYLAGGHNALNFDGKDRVKFDSSPPDEIVGQPVVWTVETAGCTPWLIGPADEHGDPLEEGGEGGPFPFSQVPNAYRSSKGFCITLRPGGKLPRRMTLKVSVRCGDWVGIDGETGEEFSLVTWG